jgi:hypothetical protein
MARNHLEKEAVDRNTKFSLRCRPSGRDSDASASSLPTEMNIAGKSAVMLRTTDDSSSRGSSAKSSVPMYVEIRSLERMRRSYTPPCKMMPSSRRRLMDGVTLIRFAYAELLITILAVRQSGHPQSRPPTASNPMPVDVTGCQDQGRTARAGVN